jgi:hypothetical protein
MSYSVKIEFNIKQDGEDFHSTVLTYDNLPYDVMWKLENVGVNMVNELLSFGDPKVVAKVHK